MSSFCGDHCHVEVAGEKQKKTLYIVFFINFFMFGVVLISALKSGSSSLLSGCIDNFGDAFTYALTLFAASQGFLAKAKVSLFKGVLILLAASAIAVQVAYKIYNPAAPIFEIMGVVGFLSLLANAVSLGFLWRHREDDINMLSVWTCARNDVIENVAVLVAAAGVWIFQSVWPDLIIAIVLVLFLFRSGWSIVKRSLSEYQKHKNCKEPRPA